ncbi:glycoside hydrolase [Liberibacter crescens]|nr:glycoside hydrolase [Liberibacter crescens]
MKKNVRQVKELRASWVAHVLNLDWPSEFSLSIENKHERVRVQKQEMIRILDEIQDMHMNTIVLQVKPSAEVLYHSDILPWSRYLTGTLGNEPGFDPLAYVLEAAHARNISVYAWLNPYRVSMDTNQSTIDEFMRLSHSSCPSVFTQHHEWIKTSYNRFVLDPGLPEVRKWLVDIIEEIVRRYNIDGIQFDDYFYYESDGFALDDQSTYEKYGVGLSKESWRRHNTYQLIKEISQKIKIIKPHVQFGISPAIVWRNKDKDPSGSDTQVLSTNYDDSYADTRQWVFEGIIDTITPQIYSTFAYKKARYDVVLRWWSDVVKKTDKTKLYVGMALYKVGVASSTQPDWTIKEGVPEIERQLLLNEELPEVKGCMLFRHLFLREPQTQAVVSYLKKKWQNSY